MSKLLQRKWLVLLLAAAGLVALALLAAALRDFTFLPSEPFSFNLDGLRPPAAPFGAAGMTDIVPWKILLFTGLLLFVFVVIMLLLDAEARKRVLLKLFRLVMSMLAIWLVMNYAYTRGNLSQLFSVDAAQAAQNGANGAGPAAPVYSPPSLNPWLIFAASFAFVLALLLLGWFIYRRLPKPRPATLGQIASIARQALDGLQPGRDWDDAIVQAYVRMHQLVSTERGLLRPPGSTPSEFAQRMEHEGLPGEAVRVLTGLFERVRYGGGSASPAERDLAAAALSAILHACGVTA